MKVGVLDYGVGNLGSVVRALEELDVTPILISRPDRMRSADCLILPGVGNFTDCKNLLDKEGWSCALTDEVIVRDKPLLGICLGMQLLADFSKEGAIDGECTAGLGLIKGQVHSLKSLGCSGRIPHMGWNSISLKRSAELLRGIPEGTDFYFVHSYAFVPDCRQDIIAVADYDIPISAVIGRGHVWGTQFHPEKSSRAGFMILRNFINGAVC